MINSYHDLLGPPEKHGGPASIDAYRTAQQVHEQQCVYEDLKARVDYLMRQLEEHQEYMRWVEHHHPLSFFTFKKYKESKGYMDGTKRIG